MEKVKKRSTTKYLIKERFIEDLILLFDKISNTPEQHRKDETIQQFMSRATSYHKRVLSLYFEHLLGSGKYLWFFQPFQQTNQYKDIRISLLDLKIVTMQRVYGNDLFHKLEKYVEQLPESAFRFVTALFSKVNISGLSLNKLREIYEQYNLKEFETPLDDLSLNNFSIKEDIKEKYKGKIEQFSLYKFPVILCSIQSDILYYFKKSSGIVSNLNDSKLLSKFEQVFEDKDIYIVFTYIDNEFNLIYMKEKPLHLIKGEVKGLYLDDMTFNQNHLAMLGLCTNYKFIEHRVCRSIKQVLSFCYNHKGTILFLHAMSYYIYRPNEFIRRVIYKGMADNGILMWQEYHNRKKIVEMGYSDVLGKEVVLSNLEISDLEIDDRYYILYRDYGKAYVFNSSKMGKTNMGYTRKIKIKEGDKGFELFK